MKKKTRSIVFLLFLLIILTIVYFKSFNYSFIWDSQLQIKQNPLLKKGYHFTEAFKHGFWEPIGLKPGKNDYYRPIVTLSFMVNKKIGGYNPLYYRISNLLIFYFSLILLYFFIKKRSKNSLIAEITILIFALNPLNLDNIVWIIGRCDIFLFLWGMLSIISFDKYIRTKNKKFMFYSFLFFLLGIFSKEAFLFFLPFLIIFEYLTNKKITIAYHISNFLLILFFFFIKMNVVGNSGFKLSFFSTFLKNIKSILGASGFYFKSIILPFNYSMFLPIDKTYSSMFYFLGVIFIIILLYLLYLLIKKSDLSIQILFILIFYPAHLLLIFTNLYPFSISTRYLMLPLVGFSWIITGIIFKTKEKARYFIIIFLLLSFIFSISLNLPAYKNEEKFWEKLYNKAPKNSFILAEYSRSLYVEKKYLASEYHLKNALEHKMNKNTAALIGILYANLMIKKAYYNKALKWIDKINKLRLDPAAKKNIKNITVNIYIMQGKIKKAENFLKNLIKKEPENISNYIKLYNTYIIYNLWGKAKTFEKLIEEKFKNITLNTKSTMLKIKKSDTFGKFKFYLHNRNFNFAARVFTKNTLSRKNHSTSNKILLAELYIKAGKGKKGEKIIKNIYENNQNNTIIINKIANFYLNDLYRIKESLYYYKKSLKLNPNQNKIKNIIRNLELFNKEGYN